MASNGTAASGVPPQNLEAEESVLGAMMVSQATIDPVILDERLMADDFYRDRHRTIFEAIVRLHEDADPVDVLTVSEELSKHGHLEQVGGKDVVASLAARVPAPGSAGHYAKIVKQNSLMRRLDAAGKSIVASVAERDGNASDMVENAERLLFNVAHEDRVADFREIGEILHEEIDKLEALATGKADVTGTPSGFRDLDEMTGGFQPGNLVVIAARPSMGKSGLGLQHRRERRGQAESARRPVLARDVGDGARPPLHRVAGADRRRQAAQGAGIAPGLAEGREGGEPARAGASLDRRLL